MVSLQSVVAALSDSKRWDQNPLLAIGLKPAFADGEIDPDILFDFCLKLARAQVAAVHPDRTGTESDEHKDLSAAFEHLKDRSAFTGALAELRTMAASERDKISQLEREIRFLKESRREALEQAEKVSRESALLQSQAFPNQQFLRALLQVAGMKVRLRKGHSVWAKPGAGADYGLEQQLVYTNLWAHGAPTEGRQLASVTEFVKKLHTRARKESRFPWEVISRTRPRETYARVLSDHAHLTQATRDRLEGPYQDSLAEFLAICERMDLKRRLPSEKIKAEQIVCGMRVSKVSPDGTLYISMGGEMPAYRVIGSIDAANSKVITAFEGFGNAGFIEVPWETAVRHVSPLLIPGWFIVGMPLREVQSESTLQRKPTVEVLSNMTPHKMLLLGRILAIE